MAIWGCFSGVLGKKKRKSKVSVLLDGSRSGSGNLQVNPEDLMNSKVSSKNGSSNRKLPFDLKEPSKVKVVGEEDAAAYEGGDERDETPSIKRDLSDFELQARAADGGENDPSGKGNFSSGEMPMSEMNRDRSSAGIASIESGHASDPGMEKPAFWGYPKLQRSCSNLETRDSDVHTTRDRVSHSKPRSVENLQEFTDETAYGIRTSPTSAITSCSADMVTLKRRSSSQLLPSRSKRLWWKLFLWSHRNLHKPNSATIPELEQMHSFHRKDGYTSDPLEPSRPTSCLNDEKLEKMESPGSISAADGGRVEPNWDDNKFNGGSSDVWPQNHWVAFRAEPSPRLSRLDEWVRSLEILPSVQQLEDANGGNKEEEEKEMGENFVCSELLPEMGGSESSTRMLTAHTHITNTALSEDILQANCVIRSLNSLSTVAHIGSMGLKVIPNMSPFSRLRSVDLSGNFIVHISAGSLPKGLHTLDLSRNKITTIEGLRELTRLRVLDLSYNRISRIGHGLSNCIIIKELYLAGNKINEVEGLHRLLKLTVLDLSFNKITTANALSQLVANYNSLLALNLLGNPIQSNIGDEQLRKTVSSLLPRLTYLNKQPIKPLRAGETGTSSIGRTALGSSSWSSRRKASSSSRRGAQSSSSSRGRVIEAAGCRHPHRSRNHHQHSPSARK